jgi:hypothetical protein
MQKGKFIFSKSLNPTIQNVKLRAIDYPLQNLKKIMKCKSKTQRWDGSSRFIFRLSITVLYCSSKYQQEDIHFKTLYNVVKVKLK